MKRLMFGGAVLTALVGAVPATAADLAVKAPVYKAPVYKAPVAPPWSWAGTYVGANVGYGWSSDPATLSDGTTITSVTSHDADVPNPTFVANPTIITPAAIGSGSASVNGWLGGAQIGHNWQSDWFVYGLEADIQGTGQRGSVTICDTVGCPGGTGFGTASYKLPWFATFRGRVGFTPASRWLVYATGGLAVAQIDQSISGGVFGGAPALLSASSNTTRAGFVVGGGVETAFADAWSLKVEYLYMDYGSVGISAVGAPVVTTAFNGPRIETITTSTATASWNTHITDNIVRVGLNYRISAY